MLQATACLHCSPPALRINAKTKGGAADRRATVCSRRKTSSHSTGTNCKVDRTSAFEISLPPGGGGRLPPRITLNGLWKCVATLRSCFADNSGQQPAWYKHLLTTQAFATNVLAARGISGLSKQGRAKAAGAAAAAAPRWAISLRWCRAELAARPNTCTTM